MTIMNIKGATITIVLNLALSTGIIQGKLNDVRTSTEKNEVLVDDSATAAATPTRKLNSGLCFFNGETRQPGQWVTGPTLTCLCDPHGSSTWVDCVQNDDHAAPKSPSGPAEPTPSPHKNSGLCSFDGKTRQPGQWLEGPTETCLCDRHGSSAWVDCVKNDAPKSPSGPNLDAAIGRRQEFDAKDFVFDLLGSVPGSIADSGSVQSLTVNQQPSLAGQGLSCTLVNLEPCGINLPHVHPRATELIYVIDGPKDHLRAAFVEENGGRIIVNEIGQGETMLFPEGLIHHQQNLSCEPVTFLAALNSEDPGVVTITTQFFELPNEALVASLNQKPSVVQKLIAGLPAGPAEGREQCMKKCGLTWSW